MFLGVVAVGRYFGAFQLQWSNLVAAAAYAMNYVMDGVWITGHIWSLSVEDTSGLFRWKSSFIWCGRSC